MLVTVTFSCRRMHICVARQETWKKHVYRPPNGAPGIVFTRAIGYTACSACSGVHICVVLNVHDWFILLSLPMIPCYGFCWWLIRVSLLKEIVGFFRSRKTLAQCTHTVATSCQYALPADLVHEPCLHEGRENIRRVSSFITGVCSRRSTAAKSCGIIY